MLPCLVECRSHLRRTSQFLRREARLAFRPDFRAFFSCGTHSSKFGTLFQVPYPLSPLLATLTKTAGVCPNSSHFGTRLSRNRTQFVSPNLSLTIRPVVPFAVPLSLICYPLSFQTIAHSVALSCISKDLNPFIFKRFRTVRQKTKRSLQLIRPPLHLPNSTLSVSDHGTRFTNPEPRGTNNLPAGCRLLRRMLRFGVP
jgi:hypothetical protein